MQSLRASRELPIKPYEKQPGQTMDTHVEIGLRRNSEKKFIALYFSFVSIENRPNGLQMRGYGFSSPSKSFMIDASPTHEPKKFAAWETILLGAIDCKHGETWDKLQYFLASCGRELAEETCKSLKHTPGPWEISPKDECRVNVATNYFIHPCEPRIATAADLENFGDDCHDDWNICQADNDSYSRGYDECVANARLIAAAPELFDACEALVMACHMDTQFGRGCGEIYTAAKAAIAKAKGEPCKA